MESMRGVITEVNKQFQDPDKTTFVCVLLSEFLPLYETERLIQELTSYNIDTHCLVVNGLLFPSKESQCQHCMVRYKMQQKYLGEIDELYGEDFNIVCVLFLEDFCHTDECGSELKRGLNHRSLAARCLSLPRRSEVSTSSNRKCFCTHFSCSRTH